MSSVRRIAADLRIFGRGYLRNLVGLFFGLIFPVILILIFGAIFSGGSSGTFTVYVQNRDVGPFSPPLFNDVATPFIGALNSTNITSVQLVDASENFTQYLAARSAADGIIIPANFSLNYWTANHVNLILYGNPSQTSSTIVSGIVNGIVNQFNLNRFNGTSIIGISQTTVSAQVTKYIDFLIPGLIGFSILVSPMFSLVNISSEYKKLKLFKQLSLTPLTKFEWLISKVLFYIILSSVSFLLMVGVGIAAFDAHVVLSPWLIPFMLLGPMLFCSLGMLVGTVSKSVETASVVGQVITFPMMFLSGTFFPISIMPEYLKNLAHVLPLFYIIDGLNGVMVYGNYVQAGVDLAVVLAIAIVLFVAAAKLFKWRED
jgi:ABC-2 type transport system permease protein